MNIRCTDLKASQFCRLLVVLWKFRQHSAEQFGMYSSFNLLFCYSIMLLYGSRIVICDLQQFGRLSNNKLHQWSHIPGYQNIHSQKAGEFWQVITDPYSESNDFKYFKFYNNGQLLKNQSLPLLQFNVLMHLIRNPL